MKTAIIPPSPEAVLELGSRLRTGELVAMPTETVYGLAGNAWDPEAVAQIFAVKERPRFDPLIVHLPMPEHPIGLEDLWASGLVRRGWGDQELERVLQVCWPGPLTVVLPRDPQVLDLVTSGLETVAIRIPDHPLAQALLQAAGIPLAAPSANRFGHISPTSAQAVWQELAGRIPYILDGGVCPVGIESTIIRYLGQGHWHCLRPGGIPMATLAGILGRDPDPLPAPAQPNAPGQLPSHYAPRKPFYRLPNSWKQIQTHQGIPSLGVLIWQGDPESVQHILAERLGIPVQVWCLSRSGNTEEAAQRLFACLREMEASEAALLVTEGIGDPTGLGAAILDRLQRASLPLERLQTDFPGQLRLDVG